MAERIPQLKDNERAQIALTSRVAEGVRSQRYNLPADQRENLASRLFRGKRIVGAQIYFPEDSLLFPNETATILGYGFTSPEKSGLVLSFPRQPENMICTVEVSDNILYYSVSDPEKN